MSEIYNIVYEKGRLRFNISDMSFPLEKIDEDISRTMLELGYISFCNMGDPDLLECRVYRSQNNSGAFFILLAQRILFMAHTDSELVFCQACGHFAKLVSDTRYACDIWEEIDEDD